jgi:pyroglutamyl-peptidase
MISDMAIAQVWEDCVMPRTLITTFQTWLPHQASNSSDDLISHWSTIATLPADTHLLRHIPVDFHIAVHQVIAKIEQIQPELILCCGMAEHRSQLSVESNGRWQSNLSFTSIDLEALICCTTTTVISHNAGRFVCNYLYYQVLRYLEAQHQPQSALAHCLFIHVPLLDQVNLPIVATDFAAIVEHLVADQSLS